MSEAVLDSSAVLALLLAERGSEQVEALLPGACLSTVNLAEVIGKLGDYGMPADGAKAAVDATGVGLVNFDANQACMAGAMRGETKGAGLSLGDRACLALARQRGVVAITADGAWARLDGFEVVLIR